MGAGPSISSEVVSVRNHATSILQGEPLDVLEVRDPVTALVRVGGIVSGCRRRVPYFLGAVLATAISRGGRRRGQGGGVNAHPVNLHSLSDPEGRVVIWAASSSAPTAADGDVHYQVKGLVERPYRGVRLALPIECVVHLRVDRELD